MLGGVGAGGWPYGAVTGHPIRFLLSSGLQVVGQVAVIVLMWPDHYQLECVWIGHTIGQKVLCAVDLELVDKYTAQLSTLLLSDAGVLDDLADLLVENLFLLLPETSDFLLKGA